MAQSVIDRILAEYEKQRFDALKKRDEEVLKIHEQYPEIAEIEKKINDCGIKSTGEIIKNPAKGEEIIKQMEQEICDLKEERKRILEGCGFSENYNEIKYNCPLCEDSGFVENKKCSCLIEKIREAEYRMSNLGNLVKTQNFDNFKFDYYGNEKNKNGISPLDYIKLAYDEAHKFCDNFGTTKNLLFYGNSGLGKTFLSSCIAKEIMDFGYEVRFMSASRLFSVYDDYKFNRGDAEKNKEIIDEVYSCDLLIIDDLGTEFLTSNSLSFLYDLLNERIVASKKLIISTNLSVDEMTTRYTPRFISRLYESFKTIKFEGENIRKIL